MTTYNERLINTYGSTGLKGTLRRLDLCELYVQEKLNRFDPNKKARCSYLSLIDALDHYIVKCLKENPQELNRNDIIAYRDFLFQTFMTHPLMVLDNVLFNDDIYPLLFDSNQINTIKNYKDSLKNEIKQVAIKVNNREPINEKMHNEYLLFLIKQLDNDDPKIQTMIENSVGLLLENPHNKSLLAKEFLFKYMAAKAAKENNIPPVQVYISNDHYGRNEYDDKTNGCSYGNTSIITINRNKVISEEQQYEGIDPIVKACQTIAHETKHSVQAYEDSKGIPTFASIEYARFLIFNKYLSKENFNEYMANYRHSEIERDANIYGWTFVTKILEKFNPSLIKNIEKTTSEAIKTQYETAIGNKKTTSSRHIKEDYNVHYLDEIIKKHPEELQNHPQLQAIYNLDGTRKDIVSMIDSEESLYNTKDGLGIRKVFEEYYYSDISNNLLGNLGFESQSRDNQFKLLSRLVETFQTESQNLSHTIEVVTTKNLVEFEKTNEARIKRILELINFINSNQQLIEELIAIDVSENNKRGLGMSFEYAAKIIDNLQRKIKKREYLSETAIYGELLELSEVEYYGHRF